jgi:hypothetical protein
MHLKCLKKILLDFKVERIIFDFSLRFSWEFATTIFDILSKWDVEWAVFKRGIFDFDTFLSFDKTCDKMVCLCFEWCFYIDKETEIDKDKKMIFTKIIFSKCLIKFADDSTFHIHNPMISFLNNLNHQIMKSNS